MKQAMRVHLTTEVIGAPAAYVKAVMCRDIFHCTPSTLRKENAVEVYQILTALGVEGEEMNRKMRRA